MKIEILGTGCKKCTLLFESAKEAVAKKGGFHSVEKVEDIQKIMDYGVISTPGLVIDSKVVSTAKVLTANEILALMD